MLPEWRTQVVCHAAPPGKLQSLFFDGLRVVLDERLICYPIRNVSGRLLLVPFGDTVSQTNVLCFARINVVSA